MGSADNLSNSEIVTSAATEAANDAVTVANGVQVEVQKMEASLKAMGMEAEDREIVQKETLTIYARLSGLRNKMKEGQLKVTNKIRALPEDAKLAPAVIAVAATEFGLEAREAASECATAVKSAFGKMVQNIKTTNRTIKDKITETANSCVVKLTTLRDKIHERFENVKATLSHAKGTFNTLRKSNTIQKQEHKMEKLGVKIEANKNKLTTMKSGLTEKREKVMETKQKIDDRKSNEKSARDEERLNKPTSKHHESDSLSFSDKLKHTRDTMKDALRDASKNIKGYMKSTKSSEAKTKSHADKINQSNKDNPARGR